MSWFFSSSNLSSITQLLDNPNTTVEMVLDDESLISALRNSLQSLLNFLFDNNNLTHLLDIVLTNYDTKLPPKTIRNALQVFTTGSCQKIFTILQDNELFLNRINDFPDSEYVHFPKPCGHYGKIIEAFARFSSGKFLAKITTLKKLFIEHMSNLGIRECFVTLLNDFSSSAQIDTDFLIDLTKDPLPENAFFIVSAIDNATKLNPCVFDL